MAEFCNDNKSEDEVDMLHLHKRHSIPKSQSEFQAASILNSKKSVGLMHRATWFMFIMTLMFASLNILSYFLYHVKLHAFVK